MSKTKPRAEMSGVYAIRPYKESASSFDEQCLVSYLFSLDLKLAVGSKWANKRLSCAIAAALGGLREVCMSADDFH